MIKDDGTPLTISIPVRGERVTARIWRADVGRVPLFLLDTDVAEDSPLARWIGAELYDGDPAVRVMQYAPLRVRGGPAVRALTIQAPVFPRNDGQPPQMAVARGGAA